MMILVLLGTQPQPFNRLIHELVALVDVGAFGKAKIVIQAGNTSVDDSRFDVFTFLSPEKIDTLLDEADLVITHGGAGSIFSALRKNKKVIALARIEEHVDAHQTELATALYDAHYLIGTPNLEESVALLDTFSFKKYKSSQQKIVAQIETWLGI